MNRDDTKPTPQSAPLPPPSLVSISDLIHPPSAPASQPFARPTVLSSSRLLSSSFASSQSFNPLKPSPAPTMAPGKSRDPSKKRPADPADKPPPKRLKHPPPKLKHRLTWFDTIRDAWNILEQQNPARHNFRMREIIKLVDAEWHTLRGDEKKHKQWRSHLSKAIRKDAMLTRAPAEGLPDLYAMKDPHFQPPPPRPVKKSLSPENDNPAEESPYRASIPTEWFAESFKPVRISTFDKSSAIHLLKRGPNTIKGYKGFRMARATSGVLEGDWYFEAKLLQTRDPSDVFNGAVRLGWSQRRADIETPVGFDAYGFGIRDRSGDFIHAARLRPYGEPFGAGDVIGCRISLPDLTDDQKVSVKEADERWLQYRFISMLQGPAPADCGIDIIKGAMVQFYKNGKAFGVPSHFADAAKIASSNNNITTQDGDSQTDGRSTRRNKTDSKGTAGGSSQASTAAPPQREMKAGVYYPSIALYGSAVAVANFGPEFECGLPAGSRPMCEAAREAPVVEDKEVVEVVPGAEKQSSNPEIAQSASHLPSSSPIEPPKRTEDKQQPTQPNTTEERNTSPTITLHHHGKESDGTVEQDKSDENIETGEIRTEPSCPPSSEPMAVEA